jgi:hypothetical protein
LKANKESSGFTSFISLDKVTEGRGLDGSEDSVINSSLEKVSILWKLGGTLKIDLDSSFGGFGLGNLSVLDALQNFLSALGLSYMLNADMNMLFNDSSIDQLVHKNTNGSLGNVEDIYSSSSRRSNSTCG